MNRTLVALAVTVGVLVASTDAPAASPASCEGILVSSLAGQPGVVGALTRQFHDDAKAAGIPPGFFDAAGAFEHAGSVDACLAVLGP